MHLRPDHSLVSGAYRETSLNTNLPKVIMNSKEEAEVENFVDSVLEIEKCFN